METNDSGQTKIIIITSNEDIIQQFSSNTTTHTHIIDLDQNAQATGIDPSMINLAFFAQLPGLVCISLEYNSLRFERLFAIEFDQ